MSSAGDGLSADPLLSDTDERRGVIGVGRYRVLDLCDQLRVPKCAAPPAVADSRGKVAPVVNRKSCNSPIADGRTVRIKSPRSIF